ncbi:MAG TPA: DUF1080 domain-containing protein [Chitinophagaceae bacterium]|nr:DUF1080 domain-containing protein [Chitinophagaceae bacterium]
MRLFIPFCFLFLFCGNHSSEEQETPRWKPLFNGKDLKDWKPKITGYALNDNYANTFIVENGVMKVKYDEYPSFDGKFGHIFHKEKFSYYLLGIEYRFTGEQCKNGPGWALRNSGVMLHCQAPETMLKDQDFPICLEAQFLGGNGKDPRTTANLCTPGTNVYMNGELFTTHCTNSSSQTYHGDQWVRVELLVLGDSIVKHIINKKVVIEYTKPQIGGGNVSNYDAAIKKDGMLLKEGYIALQSESHPIEFRKVEIIDLQKYAADKKKLEVILKQILPTNR